MRSTRRVPKWLHQFTWTILLAWVAVACSDTQAIDSLKSSFRTQSTREVDLQTRYGTQDFLLHIDLQVMNEGGEWESVYPGFVEMAQEDVGEPLTVTEGFQFYPSHSIRGIVTSESGELIPSVSVDFGLIMIERFQAERLVSSLQSQLPEGVTISVDQLVETPVLVEFTTADLSLAQTNVRPGDVSSVDFSPLDRVGVSDRLRSIYVFGQSLPATSGEAFETASSPYQLLVERWREGRVELLGYPENDPRPVPIVDDEVQVIEQESLGSTQEASDSLGPSVAAVALPFTKSAIEPQGVSARVQKLKNRESWTNALQGGGAGGIAGIAALAGLVAAGVISSPVSLPVAAIVIGGGAALGGTFGGVAKVTELERQNLINIPPGLELQIGMPSVLPVSWGSTVDASARQILNSGHPQGVGDVSEMNAHERDSLISPIFSASGCLVTGGDFEFDLSADAAVATASTQMSASLKGINDEVVIEIDGYAEARPPIAPESGEGAYRTTRAGSSLSLSPATIVVQITNAATDVIPVEVSWALDASASHNTTTWSYELQYFPDYPCAWRATDLSFGAWVNRKANVIRLTHASDDSVLAGRKTLVVPVREGKAQLGLRLTARVIASTSSSATAATAAMHGSLILGFENP